MSSQPTPTTVISAQSAVGQVFGLLAEMIRAAPQTATLAWALAARNIRARYRSTFLGILWTMIPPFVVALGFALANKAQIFRAADTALPYLLYVLGGTTTWQIFAESLESPYTALDQARSYITRVSFPREALIVAQFFESLISMSIKLVILIGFALALDVRIGLSAALLPVVFVGVLALGYSIGLLICPLLILFPDLQQALRLLLAYGLFLTPVAYAPPSAGVFHWIIALNPVTPFMMSARDVLSGWQLSYGSSTIMLTLAAAALLAAGLALMRVAMPFLIERMLVGTR